MFRKLLSLFRNIDVVQDQVDDLVDSLDGVENDNRFFRQTYGMSHRQCLTLGTMILKMQDDCLSTRSQRRFHKLLHTKTGAARYYFDFQELTLMLYMLYRPQSASCGCLSNICNAPMD